MREKAQKSPANAAVYLALTLLVLGVFGQTTRFGFVNFDDPLIVLDNTALHGGLSAASIRWAFTTFYTENWLPLTWISHLLDFSLFGLNPAAFHLVNILLHLGSAFLLFAFLRNATETLWPSALVAALFAVHPMRAESVAWISERKDVLCGFFWMLTLIAYVRWARTRRAGAYAFVLLACAAALLAKPMAVKLPFVLLLLDYWPLRRWAPGKGAGRAATPLVAEKLPLFAMAAAIGVVTFAAHAAGVSMRPEEAVPFVARIANALDAYYAYLQKTIWPVDLAPFYPHPGIEYAPVTALLKAMALGIVTGGLLALGRQMPWLAVGWLWFLGALVPVIGVIQVGDQAYADRYTYLPLIGVYIIIAFTVGAYSRGPIRHAAAAFACAAVVALAARAHVQTGYWRDSIRLWTRSLEVTGGNSVAHNNLGRALHAQGRVDEARAQYEAALAIFPGMPDANTNLGIILLESGEAEGALRYFENALAMAPDEPRVHLNRGIALSMMGLPVESETAFRKSLELRPGYPPALYNLGALLANRRAFGEAQMLLAAALDADPGNTAARHAYAKALLGGGNMSAALVQWEEIIRLKPDDFAANLHLGTTLTTIDELDHAEEHLKRALTVDPLNEDARQAAQRLREKQDERRARGERQIPQGEP